VLLTVSPVRKNPYLDGVGNGTGKFTPKMSQHHIFDATNRHAWVVMQRHV